jgi:hypothetical protein
MDRKTGIAGIILIVPCEYDIMTLNCGSIGIDP